MYSEIEVTIKSVDVSGLVPLDSGSCDPFMEYYFSACDDSEAAPQGKKNMIFFWFV